MAARFDYQSIFQEESWTKVFDNAEGKDDEFYQLVIGEFERSNYPNLEISRVEVDSNTSFFGKKDKREMVMVQAKESKFAKYHVFFSANIMGNVCQFARYECMQRGFFNKIASFSGEQLRAQLRLQCNNLTDWETFTMLDNLSDIIYSVVMRKMDVDFEQNKRLLSFKNK